jgi:hypothetical protein
MDDKATVVPPRDPWPFSTVTVEELEALVSDGLLCPLSGGPQPEWMAPESEADPTPPPRYMVSFIPFHERGFGMPASRLEFVISQPIWRGGSSFLREWSWSPVCNGICLRAKCNCFKY